MPHYFRLSTYDERDNNFITLRDNLDGGPLIYCTYLDYLCPTCRSFDKAALFAREEGLEGGPEIRVSKGRELVEARDGFLLIKNRVLELFQKHEVKGYETRPIPCTEWHVLRVTTRFPYKSFIPERTKPPCKTCGRGAYYGIAKTLSHIAVPEDDHTLFAPEVERDNGYEVYLTESVAGLLKSAGVKGGYLARLVNDDEYRLLCEHTPQARRKVKNLNVFLT